MQTNKNNACNWPSHLVWFPTLPFSCLQDSPRSPAWTLHTRHPKAGGVCWKNTKISLKPGKQKKKATKHYKNKQFNLEHLPIFIKNCHLRHKCSFSIILIRAVSLPLVRQLFHNIWEENKFLVKRPHQNVKITLRCKTIASYFKVPEAHTGISGGHAIVLSPPGTRHSEQKGVGLHHVAVTGFELLAGHDQCGQCSQLGLTAVLIQRHLLFTCRHLLYWTTCILEKQKLNRSSKHLLA